MQRAGLAIVTGSAGLVGSETVRLLADQGLEVVGVDNDSRASFFGPSASVSRNRNGLLRQVPGYRHRDLDVRDRAEIERLFRRYRRRVGLVVHAAAQPSHDWAALQPHVDFSVNALGTLNLLEATRSHCSDAVFVLISTNKVYGDHPNRLAFEERPTRWELAPGHPFHAGIDESMPVDRCLHSLFGASKLAADVLVQEYGRYFGLRSVCFRCGCLTGPAHAGARQHGFLSYLVRCAVRDEPYTVIGYDGKQVRDNLHATDLAHACWLFFRDPRPGEVYNLGGGRGASCSVVEAIETIRRLRPLRLRTRYLASPRRGDHRWWITDTTRFRRHYPEWLPSLTVESLLEQMLEAADRERGDRSAVPETPPTELDPPGPPSPLGGGLEP